MFITSVCVTKVSLPQMVHTVSLKKKKILHEICGVSAPSQGLTQSLPAFTEVLGDQGVSLSELPRELNLWLSSNHTQHNRYLF